MALPFKHKLLLATPLPATWMSNVIIHNVYIKFYTDVIGLSPEYVGWVYLAFNLWNILNDPIFGVLLDKMRYRPGRGKFLFVMRRTIPLMLVGLAAMAWSSPSWPQGVILAVCKRGGAGGAHAQRVQTPRLNHHLLVVKAVEDAAFHLREHIINPFVDVCRFVSP